MPRFRSLLFGLTLLGLLLTCAGKGWLMLTY